MSELQDKTILLLAPSFFGYEIEIQKELEGLGAKVIYWDERPRNDFFTKVLIRLNFKKMIFLKIQKYYNNILSSIDNEKIDYLFLVSPETITEKIILKIKEKHKNIKIFIYLWDSIQNKKNTISLLNVSDQFFTFDSSDVTVDKNIRFLPLFYIKNYTLVANKKDNLEYDISFVGTVHSDRYKIVKKIESIAKQNGLSVYTYFYSPSKILFFTQKLFKKEFKSISRDDISFDSLSQNDVLDIIEKSMTIVDIHHPKQVGLTMRTIEVMGAKRKLLTTNKDIKQYDFFSSDNIFIFDRNSPNIDIDFLSRKSKEIEKRVYDKYSLREWLIYIFKESTK